MSNQASIYVTKFITLDQDGEEIDTSFGLRVTDDMDCAYSNTFEESEVIGVAPAALVDMARGIGERAAAIIDFSEANKEGIHIGDVFHKWSDIKATGSPPAP